MLVSLSVNLPLTGEHACENGSLASTVGMLGYRLFRDEERLGDSVPHCVEKNGKEGEGEPANLKLITSKICWREDFHPL